MSLCPICGGVIGARPPQNYGWTITYTSSTNIYWWCPGHLTAQQPPPEPEQADVPQLFYEAFAGEKEWEL